MSTKKCPIPNKEQRKRVNDLVEKGHAILAERRKLRLIKGDNSSKTYKELGRRYDTLLGEWSEALVAHLTPEEVKKHKLRRREDKRPKFAGQTNEHS